MVLCYYYCLYCMVCACSKKYIVIFMFSNLGVLNMSFVIDNVRTLVPGHVNVISIYTITSII